MGLDLTVISPQRASGGRTRPTATAARGLLAWRVRPAEPEEPSAWPWAASPRPAAAFGDLPFRSRPAHFVNAAELVPRPLPLANRYPARALLAMLAPIVAGRTFKLSFLDVAGSLTRAVDPTRVLGRRRAPASSNGRRRD